jgi:hypothetical protein
VVKEDLIVGKRAVEQGGVRVTSHVVETPVQEQVRLHEERVTVDRRPINRPLTGVAADAFRDRTLSVDAKSEEAVVSKVARVVEEIGLHKEATDRVETVRDTIRETKVDVEQDQQPASPASQTPCATTPPPGPWTTRSVPTSAERTLPARSDQPQERERRETSPGPAARISGAPRRGRAVHFQGHLLSGAGVSAVHPRADATQDLPGLDESNLIDNLAANPMGR